MASIKVVCKMTRSYMESCDIDCKLTIGRR